MNDAPFISLPIYTAATNAAVTITEPPPVSETINTTNGGPKYNNKNNNICFRLLCHASRIGGFIGKSGCIVKQLQHDTSSKIRVDNALPGFDYSVISIVADSIVNKTMSFDEKCSSDDNVDCSEYTEVSCAQEGLVRVYERILNVAAETDGCYFGSSVVVSCRLLVDSSLVGFVVGKGGKGVHKIRKDTGCKIIVCGREKLPSCAMPNDDMIEIEGCVPFIKRAIIAVSRRLQDCRPPSDNVRTDFGKPYKGYNRKAMSRNGLMDLYPRRSHNGFNQEHMLPNGQNGHMDYPLTRHSNGFNRESMLPNGHMDLRANNNSSRGGPPFGSREVEIAQNFHDQHEIIFRMLCTGDRVRGVIGNSGEIVRALENELGALISVSNPALDCNERIITITAFERPESRNSPAQNAVIRVFSMSVEASHKKGLDSPLSGSRITARLVIPPHQMGCLLGRGGSIMADMRKVTGAYIKIVGGNEIPRCALGTDQVVLMTGDFVNVRDALYSVTSRLRNHLFSSKTSSGPKTNGQGNGQPPFEFNSSMPPHHFNQHTTLTQSMDNLRPFDDEVDDEDHNPSSSGPCQSQMNGEDVDRGSTIVKGGVELDRGGRSAIITNTIVEIMVPENVIGLVYGENGSNLTRLRQISGAKVVVHKPGSGSTDHIVVISGTPDQTQLGQTLLQAFILADQK